MYSGVASGIIRKSLLCVTAYLLPRVVGNITNEQISTLSETYETDLVCNFEEFNWGVARWQTRTLVYNISRVLPW